MVTTPTTKPFARKLGAFPAALAAANGGWGVSARFAFILFLVRLPWACFALIGLFRLLDPQGPANKLAQLVLGMIAP